MPRIAQFTKDDIAQKAIEIIRIKGPEALSARSLGAALGCSSRPIFTVFKNMEEVLQYTRMYADKLFSDYVADINDYSPAFKEFGLRLIRFAREEQNLFNFLFLDKDAPRELIHPAANDTFEGVCKQYDMTREQAEKMFLQIWVYTCGLALLSSKEPEIYTDEIVSELLSTQFQSAMAFAKSGKEVISITPKRIK